MFCTNKLEEHIDLRYEQNASQKELDILETLFDHFVTEEEPNMTEDEPSMCEAYDMGVDLEEWLAREYYEYTHPDERVGGRENKDYFTLHSFNDFMTLNLKVGIKRKDIVAAAKDAYERKKSLIERYKSRTKINHVPARLLPVLQKTGFDLSLNRL